MSCFGMPELSGLATAYFLESFLGGIEEVILLLIFLVKEATRVSRCATKKSYDKYENRK